MTHEHLAPNRGALCATRLLRFAVASLALVPLSAGSAWAQSTSASAGGGTVALTVEQATVTTGGIDPRIIALVSIQNGDAPIVPGSLLKVHLEASIIGSGRAGFGTLAGRLDAQARNQAAFQNLFEPYSFGSMRLGFTDGGFVTSSTLAAGTPVNIIFVSSLAASFFATTPKPISHNSNGANVEFVSRVTNDLNQALGGATLLFGSAGTVPGTQLFTVSTTVGAHLRFTGDMRIDVAAATALQENPAGGDLIATSSIVADQTAHLYYEATPGVTLTSDSGHDYAFAASTAAAPEPYSATLLGVGVMVAGCGVRQRRRNR